MAEFSTSATIDVQVSPGSLREARGTIEDELGGAQVDVSSSTGGGSGGRMAGRERAMGRQLQTETNNHLTENLDLNRERNELLRRLVDINEKDAQTSRGGGGMGGALGLAIGGIGLGSMLLGDLGSTIGDAIPELSPGDVLSPVAVTVQDVVDTAASLAPMDVIAEAATLTPAALIASKASVVATDVIDTLATVGPSDVITGLATVGASDVIAKAATISPAVLVASAAAVTASSVVGSLAEIGPSDVIASAVELVPSDIVVGTITAQDILNRVTDPNSSPSGSPSGGGKPWAPIAGAAGGVGAWALGNSGKLGQIGKGASGAATPVITPGMMKGSDETARNRKRAREATPDFMNPIFPEDPFWENNDGQSSGGGSIAERLEASAEQNNRFEINVDTDDLEREASKKFNEVERRLKDLENVF
ncbi:hypothetical protein HYG81_15140 [Natrinema zhouii]|uniref:Uncharacterized protein n=1 Tax=Natrinema zhouii TaxID=1710539 RepID=A0A7D6H541_9EURY|nr:hypothetical protein [Natrinema zhouii]QLK25408.1 hypothetical protein HYG81_15140 [Natrinema zhouii]